MHALRLSLDKFGTREQRRAAEKQDREELLSRADAGRLAKQEMDTEAQVGWALRRMACNSRISTSREGPLALHHCLINIAARHADVRVCVPFKARPGRDS